MSAISSLHQHKNPVQCILDPVGHFMGEEMRVQMGRHVVLDPVEHEDRIWIVGVVSKYIHKHVYNNIVTLTGQNKKKGEGETRNCTSSNKSCHRNEWRIDNYREKT